MSETLPNGTIILDTPDDIAFARLLALRGALRLEQAGLRMSRNVSALQVAKRMGYRGSRKTILAQVEADVEATIRRRHEGAGEINVLQT